MDITILESSAHAREHDAPGYYVPVSYRDGTKYGGYFQSIRRGSRDAMSGKSVIYVEVASEAFWDSFANRTSRPFSLWKQPILKHFGKEFPEVDCSGMHWYAKAGCTMCPCSPGFILPNHRGVDYWVKLDSAIRTEDPEQAAFRLLQVAADPTISGIGVTL